MRLTTSIVMAALALTLGACESNGPAAHEGPLTSTSARATRTTTHSDDGIVIGTFTRVGGPILPTGAQPPPVPLMGTVSFSASHRRTVAVLVGKTGRFSVGLPAGSYMVSGRSPSVGGVSPSGALVGPPCTPPVPVTVVANRTVHVSVVCAVP